MTRTLAILALAGLVGCASPTPSPSSKNAAVTPPGAPKPVYFTSSKAKLQRAREGYVKAHPELPADVREAIMAGEVQRGMTREQAAYAWGTATRADSTVTAAGQVETWYYSEGAWGCDYLFFSGGRLTGWRARK